MDEKQVNLTAEDFVFLGEQKSIKTEVRPSTTFWQDVWRRLLSNKVAMLGLGIIIIMVLCAIMMPLLSPYEYSSNDLTQVNAGMSKAHWFGTDTLGRDLWTRVWEGARISLAIGIIGAILPSLLGIVIGGIAGYFGGIIDMLIMRTIDVLMCIPSLIFVILIMLKLGNGPVAIVIAFALMGWMGTARNVRGLVLQLKNQEFINASRVLGASAPRLIFKHLIPNTLGIVIVGMTMSVPNAIFYEATLSFLGLGIKAPLTSWGQLLQLGVESYKNFPSQLFIPAAFLSITLLAFNLFGDGLRDALDPKLRD